VCEMYMYVCDYPPLYLYYLYKYEKRVTFRNRALYINEMSRNSNFILMQEPSDNTMSRKEMFSNFLQVYILLISAAVENKVSSISQ